MWKIWNVTHANSKNLNAIDQGSTPVLSKRTSVFLRWIHERPLPQSPNNENSKGAFTQLGWTSSRQMVLWPEPCISHDDDNWHAESLLAPCCVMQRTNYCSGHCRTSTANSRSQLASAGIKGKLLQWALPDLNCKLPISAGIGGHQG